MTHRGRRSTVANGREPASATRHDESWAGFGEGGENQEINNHRGAGAQVVGGAAAGVQCLHGSCSPISCPAFSSSPRSHAHWHPVHRLHGSSIGTRTYIGATLAKQQRQPIDA